MRHIVIIAAALLASTAAFASTFDQGSQSGPGIKEAIGYKNYIHRMAPLPRFARPVVSTDAPDLTDAAKYCIMMAGFDKHIMTVQKKPNGGFNFDCDIQDKKPE